MNQVKILQINAVNGIKSTGRTTKEMADFLNDNGYEGYVAYSAGMLYEKGYKIGTQFEKKVHAFYSRLFGKQAYFSKNGTKNLIKYMEQIKPDVVHLRNLHSNYINLKFLLEFLASNDIPTVVTLHDCWFYTGKCTHYTLDNCYKWQSECGNCPRLKKDNKSWFFDKTKKMHNDKIKWLNNVPRLAVVGVAKWITGEVKKSLLMPEILAHIYNWIDLDVFKPVETNDLRYNMGLEDKFVILGIASSWKDSKGLNKFFELSSFLPDDMIIVLVGAINNKIELPNNIFHIQETNNVEELVKIYSMANVLVHFSLEECCSRAIIESLACGTPIIVMNSTGNPELVGGDCGYVIKEGSAKEVLNLLNKVKINGKNIYSPHCLDFARENFDITKIINDYLNLYKELVELKGD